MADKEKEREGEREMGKKKVCSGTKMVAGNIVTGHENSSPACVRGGVHDLLGKESQWELRTHCVTRDGLFSHSGARSTRGLHRFRSNRFFENASPTDFSNSLLCSFLPLFILSWIVLFTQFVFRMLKILNYLQIICISICRNFEEINYNFSIENYIFLHSRSIVNDNIYNTKLIFSIRF